MAWTVSRLGQRLGWQERRRTLELYAILAVQAGVAAAVAWTVAHELLHRPSPVFAPTAAVGAVAASIGRRSRRTVELLVGVLAGILLGEALIAVIGTGPWQIGTVVTIAILAGLVLGHGGQVVTQAGGTAVLVATLAPAQRGLELPRVIDAIVGGLAALAVVAVLPLNPIRIVRRSAHPLFGTLIEQLHTAADGMASGDADQVADARDQLNQVEPKLKLVEEAVAGAVEAVAVSPFRWHQRMALEQYERGVRYLGTAVRGTQELLRRATTAVRDGEPIPYGLTAAVRNFGDALALLLVEAENEQRSHRSEALIRKAVARAAEAYDDGVGFSGNVVVAQVRTVATDLLTSIGLKQEEASTTVRECFERGRRDPQQAVRETAVAASPGA